MFGKNNFSVDFEREEETNRQMVLGCLGGCCGSVVFQWEFVVALVVCRLLREAFRKKVDGNWRLRNEHEDDFCWSFLGENDKVYFFIKILDLKKIFFFSDFQWKFLAFLQKFYVYKEFNGKNLIIKFHVVELHIPTSLKTARRGMSARVESLKEKLWMKHDSKLNSYHRHGDTELIQHI